MWVRGEKEAAESHSSDSFFVLLKLSVSEVVKQLLGAEKEALMDGQGLGFLDSQSSDAWALPHQRASLLTKEDFSQQISSTLFAGFESLPSRSLNLNREQTVKLECAYVSGIPG